jgi:ATP-dependent Clp protease ATP-binding subunit ClpB
VETRIGRALLSGDIQDGADIALDALDGELTIRWETPSSDQPETREMAEASA